MGLPSFGQYLEYWFSIKYFESDSSGLFQQVKKSVDQAMKFQSLRSGLRESTRAASRESLIKRLPFPSRAFELFETGEKNLKFLKSFTKRINHKLKLKRYLFTSLPVTKIHDYDTIKKGVSELNEVYFERYGT